MTVRIDGEIVPLGGAEQRGLLAILALQLNGAVPTGALIDGLWGAELPVNARRTIHVYVSRLRAQLRGNSPQGGRERERESRYGVSTWAYAFAANPEIVDLYRFRRLLAEGSAEWPDNPRPLRTVAACAGAVDGESLREFSREPFARAESTRLAEMQFMALGLRIEADLMCGRHAELVGELEGLTQRFPLHEGLHAQLMLAL